MEGGAWKDGVASTARGRPPDKRRLPPPPSTHIAGSHHIYCARYLQIYNPRQVCISNGQQTMGVSLPWAVSDAFDARDPGRCVPRWPLAAASVGSWAPRPRPSITSPSPFPLPSPPPCNRSALHHQWSVPSPRQSYGSPPRPGRLPSMRAGPPTDKRIISISGDGGFLFCVQELETAV